MCCRANGLGTGGDVQHGKTSEGRPVVKSGQWAAEGWREIWGASVSDV